MGALDGKWALILGASSGFGEAAALELARRGMNIYGAHLDRRPTMPNVERIIGEIRKIGSQAAFFNVNAADDENRKQVLDQMKAGPVHLMFHSLAFGTLKPYIAEDAINRKQMEMTLDVMAHSLVYWTQDLVARGLMREGGRIFAMTSAGGARVWTGYGAVSAAKAALESHVRQLAVELAPRGITVNAIRAGVTDTPSLRKIPGHEQMIELATRQNPAKRLTTPADVARALAELAQPGTAWMTGNVIGVDGGEFVT
jgi:NAD(P)-dependent dehydrogenase (short-subunit alcohol dehydrogenase family)